MKKIFLLIITFFLLSTPLKIYGETYQNDIDLATEPGKVLFDITNIKPGDSIYRNLKIENNGVQDFSYITSNQFKSGSKILYDKLDLRIEDKNGVIYEGKLFEFKKLAPRQLKSKQNENVLFYICLPKELGNEFQGLDTEFQFKIYVEGTLGGILPADGPKLPSTGTAMFNLLVSGGVLVIVGMFFQFYVLIRRKLVNKNV